MNRMVSSKFVSRRRPGFLAALLLLQVLLVGAGWSGPRAAEARWFLSTIGAANDYSSLALDAHGFAHVSYLLDGKLRRATNVSGAWVSTVVDTPGTGYGGTYSSAIAVDKGGGVHIAYDGTEKLKYATNATGAWVVTTIYDPGYDVGDDVSLALDSDGRAHISFLDRWQGELLYATNASGDWTVTGLGAGGYVSSLAVDADDAVHIVHFVVGGNLVHVTNASGGWVPTVIGPGGGYHPSVKTDADRKAHVSYQNTSGGLSYATNASGSWVSSVVDAADLIAANSSLVLDAAGAAHITYSDYDTADLKYATNASGDWALSVVDALDEKGYSSSLAIAPCGALFVSYTDRSHGKVMFAASALRARFRSTGSQDGWVLESAAGSGAGGPINTAAATLRVGDNAGDRQYRAFLSFGTGRLPDTAAIVSARLKLKQQGGAGTDPYTTHAPLVVDIRTPRFGTSAALQRADFAAAAGLQHAGTIDLDPVLGFHVWQLSSSALAEINTTGTTQMRLRFDTASDDDSIADYLGFFSGNAARAANRPTLEVWYSLP